VPTILAVTNGAIVSPVGCGWSACAALSTVSSPPDLLSANRLRLPKNVTFRTTLLLLFALHLKKLPPRTRVNTHMASLASAVSAATTGARLVHAAPRRCRRSSPRGRSLLQSTPRASFNPFPFPFPMPPDLSSDVLAAAATFALRTNLRSSTSIDAAVVSSSA
jgi:hypothetical protein